MVVLACALVAVCVIWPSASSVVAATIRSGVRGDIHTAIIDSDEVHPIDIHISSSISPNPRRELRHRLEGQVLV